MTTKMESQASVGTIFTEDPDSSAYEYRETLEKILLQLSSFGLTSNQCKVYIFLGKYGSKTAPDVCRSLKIPRTETYKLLTTLQNKGMVSASFQHPIKFTAIPLVEAVHSLINTEKERIKNLENQKSELNQLWNEIPEFHNEIQETNEDKFQMLQGENQIHSKINNMLTTTNSTFLILGSEKDLIKFYHANFIDTLSESKLDHKILTSSSQKTQYIFDNTKKTSVRKLSPEIEQSLCFIVKDNDEVLFYLKNANSATDKPTAMWTTSESMIYSKKLLFDSLWSDSKVILH